MQTAKRPIWTERTATWPDGQVQGKWEAMGWSARFCWYDAWRHVRSGCDSSVCCPTWFVQQAKLLAAMRGTTIPAS